MANLITEKQIKSIGLEYLIRLVATVLFVGSLLGLFLLAYVIPYYISVAQNDLRVANQFKVASDLAATEQPGPDISQIVARTSDELKSIDVYNKNIFAPSSGFSKIIANKNGNIRLNQLSFVLIKAGQGQFVVNGIAKDRDGLVTFISDLKTKAGFASVDSPISDFAKSSDIPFTITILTKL